MARKVTQDSPQGKALQAEVQKKLREYLGQEYNDDVLPLYIVVMLAHGNNEALVAENLQAFLGDPHSANFSAWLFQLMAEQGDQYTVPVAEEEPPVVSTAPVTRAAPESEDRSRRRERTRDKIEWKEDKTASAAPRERGVERERGDRDRARDRDRPKESGGDEHYQRDAAEGARRRRDRDLSHLETTREPRVSGSRHEERGRRQERDYREREKPREYERERERSRHREQEADREWDRARPAPLGAVEGREKAPRHGDRGQLADARRSSPGRGRKDVDMAPEEAEETAARGQDRRRAATSGAPMVSAPKRVLVDALRSAGVAPAPAEPPRASVLSRLDKRPRQEESEPEAPQQKKGATSVFDRLQGVKVPLQRAAAARSLANGAGPKDAEMADAPPQPRVSKPANGLNPRAAPFTPANGNVAAVGNGAINAAPSAPAPILAPQDDQASVMAQLELMKAQLAELQQERAVQNAAKESCRVVVNFLDPRVTSEIVAAHFAGAGLVTVDVQIQRDNLGRSTGVAVVELGNEMAAQMALALSGSQLLGRPISVLPKTGSMMTFGMMGAPRPMGGAFSPAPPTLPMPGGPPFGGGVRPGGMHSGHPGQLRHAPSLGSSGFGGRFGTPGGRGRGRIAPLTSNKYIRPELLEELAKKKAEERDSSLQKLDDDLDRMKACTMDVGIV